MSGILNLLLAGAGASLNANVEAATYEGTGEGSAQALIEFRSNGDVYVEDDSSASVRYRWQTGGGTGASYRVRWTNTSGTLSGGTGTAGTWHTLSSNISYYVSTIGAAIKTCTGTVEIQMADSPNTSFDSASITLRSVSTGSGP